ncbi:MAG: DUF192 domain-containing protein [bacterium]
MLISKRNFFFAGVILFAIVIFFNIYKLPDLRKKTLLINNKKLEIEIADTTDMRYKGLSGRDYLCEECGMLFIFADKYFPTFVMRDMKFALDIIWISEGKIIKIDENLPMEGKYPQAGYVSSEGVDMVLEVNAGYCKKNNIKIGEYLTFY